MYLTRIIDFDDDKGNKKNDHKHHQVKKRIEINPKVKRF